MEDDVIVEDVVSHRDACFHSFSNPYSGVEETRGRSYQCLNYNFFLDAE